MHESPGTLLPLSARVTLGQLLARAGAAGVCGVWLGGREEHPLRVVRIHDATISIGLLIGSDLGALTRRASRVLVRRAGRVVCIPSTRLMELRWLETAAGGVAPSFHELAGTTPEAVLSRLVAERRPVTRSAIRYLG